MDLQNGYKVVYEKIADGTRTFYATKNTKCDPTVDDVIIEAAIGEYKLIYEKDGSFYGSLSGIPAEGDKCFDTENFKKVFIKDYAGEEENNAGDDQGQEVIDPETNNANTEEGNDGEGSNE